MSRSLRAIFMVSCLIWIGAGCWAGYLVGQQVIVGDPASPDIIISSPYLAHQPLREYTCDKCRIQKGNFPSAFLDIVYYDTRFVRICPHELAELIVWAMDVKDGKPFYTVPRTSEQKPAAPKNLRIAK